MQDATFQRQLLGYDRTSVDARVHVLERTVEALALQLAEAKSELVKFRDDNPVLQTRQGDVERALERLDAVVGLDPRD